MKKLLVPLFVAMLSLSPLTTPKAHALSIINVPLLIRAIKHSGPIKYNYLAIGLWTASCFWWLPLCIFEGEGGGVAQTDRDSLLANGYEPSEVDAILAGQNAAIDYLQDNNLRIIAEGDMTAAELATWFSQEIPDLPQEYADFVAENY